MELEGRNAQRFVVFAGESTDQKAVRLSIVQQSVWAVAGEK